MKFKKDITMKNIYKYLILSLTISSINLPVTAQETDTLKTVESDMVNVAFGTKSQQSINSAINVYNPEEFMNNDYNRYVQNGLDGYINGLYWGTNIWGIGDALILIDGVPSSIDNITMDEIKQITILKGASATLLYGSQAAKGAILITTKTGVIGQKKISFRIHEGISEAKSYPHYLNSADYMSLYNEALNNDGMSSIFSEEDIANYRSGNALVYPDIDYYSKDYLNRFAYNTDATAQFQGGSKNAQFFAEIGYHYGSSLLKIGEADDNNNTRFNVRGNVNMKINDFITSSINTSIVFYGNHSGVSDYWSEASTLQPQKFVPLIPLSAISSEDANLLAIANSSSNIVDSKYLIGGSQENLTTPFGDLYAGGYNEYKSRNFQFVNSINFDLDRVLKGLSVITKFNVNYTTFYNQSINNNYSVYQATWGNYLGENVLENLTKFGTDNKTGTQNLTNSSSNRNIGFSIQVNYKKDFNTKSHLNTTLVGLANNNRLNGYYQPYTNSHVGLNCDYSYDNKYYATLSGSMLASTKLASNNRIGFSPALSLGWLISNENFLKNSNWINYLKINSSLSSVKTDLYIDDYYLYDDYYYVGEYFSWDDGVRNNNASTSSRTANKDFSFSSRNEFTFGLDASLFSNHVKVNTNYFMIKMDNLPERALNSYPSYFSDFVPYGNSASNKYNGFDLGLNYNDNLGEVNLSVGANVTYVKTKISSKDELYENSYQDRVGKPINAIFGLESEGFFNSNEEIANHAEQKFGTVQPGDIKYKDQNNDGKIDDKDEVEIGNYTSPWYFTLNFNINYKNLNLFVQGTGYLGGDAIKNNDYYWVDGNDKYSEEVLNRWTETTKNTATYPRLSANSNSNNYRSSDFWIYSTDRINISRVQLTYNLPEKILHKTFIKKLLVYVNGSNLLTIAKEKDVLDLNIGSAPQYRYYNIGFKANF